MKHFARALAALVAVTLLACGMAAAEGTLDEAAFLGLWDFVEAEMDGQSATAEELGRLAEAASEQARAAERLYATLGLLVGLLLALIVI